MEKGLILKSTGSNYVVKTEDGTTILCTIKGKLRTFGFNSTNPVSAGDWVLVETSNFKTGNIVDIFERKNYLIRKSTNLSKQTHIIASNVDKAILIITLVFPETSLEFIDRFLSLAEAYNIPVTIVINKIDLYKDTYSEVLANIHDIYEPIGYKLIETSVKNMTNIESLASILKNNVSVFSGNSGVGKSSLINAICPGLYQKTATISDYHHKGKHTTTYAEMLELPDGGYIIDTPGIKGFGMVNINRNEIYHFFPEIFKISASCHYNNRLHIEEPNCAVKHAVEQGTISISRYSSYLSIIDDINSKYRGSD